MGALGTARVSARLGPVFLATSCTIHIQRGCSNASWVQGPDVATLVKWDACPASRQPLKVAREAISDHTFIILSEANCSLGSEKPSQCLFSSSIRQRKC